MRPPEETVAVAGVFALGAEVARMVSSGERTWRHPSSPVLEFTEAMAEAWRGEGRRAGVRKERCFEGLFQETAVV